MSIAGIYILLVLLAVYVYDTSQSVKELTAALTYKDEKTSEKPAVPVALDQPDGVAPVASDFAVTGKPLKPSWRIRKRELEAASRTKRQRLESFREID